MSSFCATPSGLRWTPSTSTLVSGHSWHLVKVSHLSTALQSAAEGGHTQKVHSTVKWKLFKVCPMPSVELLQEITHPACWYRGGCDAATHTDRPSVSSAVSRLELRHTFISLKGAWMFADKSRLQTHRTKDRQVLAVPSVSLGGKMKSEWGQSAWPQIGRRSWVACAS